MTLGLIIFEVLMTNPAAAGFAIIHLALAAENSLDQKRWLKFRPKPSQLTI